MLNLTRLHLGIAHESQFQGLGITCQGEYGSPLSGLWHEPGKSGAGPEGSIGYRSEAANRGGPTRLSWVGLDLLLLLLLHRGRPAGGGKVLFVLMCQSQPRLRHVD